MFSVFMDLVVPNILNLKDIENLYIEVQENQYNVKPDVFSYVLDQKLDNPPTKINFLDTEFNTVSDIESYLLKVYGSDWRIPINKKGNYT